MKPTQSAVRRALWAKAEATIMARLSSAKFLWGTMSDRQTGALQTHRWRKEFAAKRPAPADHAGLRTRGSDGDSRESVWTRDEKAGLRLTTPVAERIKTGAYKPAPLKIVQWDPDAKCRHCGSALPVKEGKPVKLRTIAVPAVIDRTVQAVIFEVLEPLLERVLSDQQHGYRPNSVNGQHIELADLVGVSRGSTRAVALRLSRALGAGFAHMAEVDVCKAFPSVDRTRLHAKLTADGCTAKFARFLASMLGSTGTDKDKTVQVSGIPLGCPYGPLLFNFFVSELHERVPSLRTGIRMLSYADNLFIAAQDDAGLSEALVNLDAGLKDLGLLAEVKQRWSASEDLPFRVLVGKRDGGFVLHREGGIAVLRGMSGSGQACSCSESDLGGMEVEDGQ